MCVALVEYGDADRIVLLPEASAHHRDCKYTEQTAGRLLKSALAEAMKLRNPD
jgi:hypothetical protein